jgi:multiple antibiotic resistance protein
MKEQWMMMPNSTSLGKVPAKWRSVALLVFAGLPLLAFATTVSAQEVTESATGQAQSVTFSFGEIFTFLFLTLGPLKLLGPFASMTRGHDAAFKRRLAVQGTVIAVIAILFACTSGVSTLLKWRVSVGCLLLTAGIVLFLVSLKPVLEQFANLELRSQASPASDAPVPSPMMLAFPTIVTPYGIALLIVLAALRAEDTSVIQIVGIVAFVLLLDLIAMLYAERILSTPFVALALGITGAVMGVLQVALSVSAMVLALRILGFKRG